MPQSEYEFKTEQSVWDEKISAQGLEKYLEQNYRQVEWKNQVRTIFLNLNFEILKNYLKTELTREQWIDESDLITIYQKAFSLSGGDPIILLTGWETAGSLYYPHHVMAEFVGKVQKNWKLHGDEGGVFIQDSDTRTTNWIIKPFSRSNLIE